jgi:hypothetical protein
MNIILNFSNLRSALLYKFELEGQISDGKYENARPYNHWEWINDTEIRIDANAPEGTSRWVRKTYNLNEWFKYIHGGDNWACRIMNYARAGLMFEACPKLWDILMRRCDYLFTRFPNVTYDGETLTRELFDKGIEAECKRWQDNIEYYTQRGEEKYRNSIESSNMAIAELRTVQAAVTDEMIERYNDPTYTERELKRDHESMKRTVNTPFPFDFNPNPTL